MDLNHLHLNSPCIEDSIEFYRQLGFTNVERLAAGSYELRNDRGFVLAIGPLDAPAKMPSWFYFGFRMDAVVEVEVLYSRLKRLGYKISQEPEYREDLMSFRCLEPAGYEVKIYWEPS